MLYQDNDQTVTVTPPAIAHSAPFRDSRSSRHHHDRSDYPFDKPKPHIIPDSPETISNGHHRSPSPVQLPVPESARPAAASPFLYSPRLEDGSTILTTSSNSSGAARKEARTHDNLSRGSSLSMSRESPSRGALRLEEQENDISSRASKNSQDALLLLFRITFPVPIFSLLASFYTVLGFIFVLIISPLRICSLTPCFQSTSFCAQLCDLLVPSLRFHERLVRTRKPPSSSSSSSSTRWVYNDPNPYGDESGGGRVFPPPSSSSDPTNYYSIPGLIIVLILSTFLCIGLVLAAWTAASFWVFAMMLGNPEPHDDCPDREKEKDDGRAAVLGVGIWWEKWLRKARKVPSR